MHYHWKLGSSFFESFKQRIYICCTLNNELKSQKSFLFSLMKLPILFEIFSPNWLASIFSWIFSGLSPNSRLSFDRCLSIVGVTLFVNVHATVLSFSILWKYTNYPSYIFPKWNESFSKVRFKNKFIPNIWITFPSKNHKEISLRYYLYFSKQYRLYSTTKTA